MCALDWHRSERVFAVAARGEGHHAHAARAAGTCRGEVGAQIWRVRDEGGPEMEVMLLGNGGCVTDARWAPEVRSVDEDGDGRDAYDELLTGHSDTNPDNVPSRSEVDEKVKLKGVGNDAGGKDANEEKLFDHVIDGLKGGWCLGRL